MLLLFFLIPLCLAVVLPDLEPDTFLNTGGDILQSATRYGPMQSIEVTDNLKSAYRCFQAASRLGVRGAQLGHGFDVVGLILGKIDQQKCEIPLRSLQYAFQAIPRAAIAFDWAATLVSCHKLDVAYSLCRKFIRIASADYDQDIDAKGLLAHNCGVINWLTSSWKESLDAINLAIKLRPQEPISFAASILPLSALGETQKVLRILKITPKLSLPTPQTTQYRIEKCVIVYKLGPSKLHLSHLRLSLTLLEKNFNRQKKYPIVIFHSKLPLSTQEVSFFSPKIRFQT